MGSAADQGERWRREMECSLRAMADARGEHWPRAVTEAWGVVVVASYGGGELGSSGRWRKP